MTKPVPPVVLPAPACACARMRRAARALTQLYDDGMAPSGLRVTQYSLLSALAKGGPARISDLARSLLLDRTALSRNLDPLVERRLVTIAHGDDARTRIATLTGTGAAALAAARPHWQQAQAQVARRLGGERFDTLLGLLGEVEALHPDGPAAARARQPGIGESA